MRGLKKYEEIIRMREIMRKFELIIPCHFGMESVLKREIAGLGYDVTEVTDGKVTFLGDEEAVCRANIFLRTAEREGAALGGIHTRGREILGGEGGKREIQAVQPLRYSVGYEKGYGGAHEGGIPPRMVPGGGRCLSGEGVPDEG